MKTARWLCGTLVIVTLVGALLAPVVSAQKFDGVWFKLKLSIKGWTLDDPTQSIISTFNESPPVYAEFVSTGGHDYDVHFWTLVDGTWSNSYTTGQTLLGTNENFLSDSSVTIVLNGGDAVHTFHTVFISSKLAGGTGEVLSATYNGVGEINTGTILIGGVTNRAFGGCTLKGKTIDASKLPFALP